MEKKEQRLVREQSLEWLQARKKTVTKSSYSTYQRIIYKNIIPNIGECEVDNIEANKRLLLESLQKYKDTTKTGVLTIFNSIMKYNSFEESNTRDVDSKDDEIEIIPVDQLVMFMDKVKKNIDSTKLGILCVIYTGLRIGELCSLKWRNVDLINNVIKVNKSLQRICTYNELGESTTVLEEREIPIRYIPIPTKLLRILLSKRGRLNDYVITGNSKQIEPRTAQYRLSTIRRETGVCTNVNYKRLRDFFAVNAIVNNVNPIVVADILGVEFDIMKKYVITAKKFIDMENEVEKLNHI